MNLETIPLKILFEIINKLKDSDFIKFISINRYFQQYTNLIKLHNIYKCSIIGKLKNKYRFTKIIYDYFDWNVNNVSFSVQELLFDNKFDRLITNDEFNYLMKDFDSLLKLKKINMKIYFDNIDNLNKLTNKINRKDITIKTIANIKVMEKNKYEFKLLEKKIPFTNIRRLSLKIYFNEIIKKRLEQFILQLKSDVININFIENSLDQNFSLNEYFLIYKNIFQKITILKEFMDIFDLNFNINEIDYTHFLDFLSILLQINCEEFKFLVLLRNRFNINLHSENKINDNCKIY